MAFTHSPDHLTRALQKLLGQFQGSAKLRALLATYLRQIQMVEDFARDVVLVISINTGFGITLDRIGKLVGRGRSGLADGDYRYALRAQIRANRSSGVTEDFIDVLMLSVDLDPLYSVEARDTGPATAEVIMHGALPPGVITVLWTSIRQVKEAGVRLEFIYSLYATDATFRCAPTLTDPTAHGAKSTTQGFGWAADPSLGGALAGEFAT